MLMKKLELEEQEAEAEIELGDRHFHPGEVRSMDNCRVSFHRGH